MSKIKIRLKEEFGKYLVISTPNTSIVIGAPRESMAVGEFGDNDPDGFEIDREIYEKYLKPYTEPVTRKQKKSEEKERIDLEE